MTDIQIKTKNTPIADRRISLVTTEKYNSACAEIEELQKNLDEANQIIAKRDHEVEMAKLAIETLRNDVGRYEGMLEASIDIHNGNLTLDELYEEIRLTVNKWSTQKAFAKKMGISPSYLCDILAKKRIPGEKVLKFFKLKAVTIFVEQK